MADEEIIKHKEVVKDYEKYKYSTFLESVNYLRENLDYDNEDIMNLMYEIDNNEDKS